MQRNWMSECWELLEFYYTKTSKIIFNLHIQNCRNLKYIDTANHYSQVDLHRWLGVCCTGFLSAFTTNTILGRPRRELSKYPVPSDSLIFLGFRLNLIMLSPFSDSTIEGNVFCSSLSCKSLGIGE